MPARRAPVPAAGPLGRGFRQLSVRGKAKTAAEWRSAATVRNLFKAITTGHLTTQALAALSA